MELFLSSLFYQIIFRVAPDLLDKVQTKHQTEQNSKYYNVFAVKGDSLNVIQFLFMIFSGEMLCSFHKYIVYMSLYHPSFVFTTNIKRTPFVWSVLGCFWLMQITISNTCLGSLIQIYSPWASVYALTFRVPAYRYPAVNYICMFLFTLGGVPNFITDHRKLQPVSTKRAWEFEKKNSPN